MVMHSIQSRGRILFLETPKVMGILNLTPDSFYAGSRTSITQIVDLAGKMLEDGADILDIGGQSTRPNSVWLSAEEEAARVIPAIESLSKSFPEAWLSIDTFHAPVAKAAIHAGAAIVNDVSGGQLDSAMLKTVGSLSVPYICMHLRGTPQNMQQQNSYADLMGEILDYFAERIEACYEAGIQDLILDPGFGFAKNIPQNFELLQKLEMLQILGKPLLVGLSRKSMIYKTLNITADQALHGSTVVQTVALMKDAKILRVHDVRAAKEAILLINQMKQTATGITS
jgi:dihydropteroate synthase